MGFLEDENEPKKKKRITEKMKESESKGKREKNWKFKGGKKKEADDLRKWRNNQFHIRVEQINT